MSFLDNNDAQTLLNRLVFDFIRQQKRARIWRVMKWTLVFAGIFFIGFNVIDTSFSEKQSMLRPHVGLIDIKGEIGETKAVDSDSVSKALAKAYKRTNLQALILRINSPGGSPVQADYIYNMLKYYRQKYPDVKVYSVCVDTCASAAYYLALGADEIYANPSSLVGSIGVIYDGFGFDDLMKKVGVSRRLIISGKEKGFLDPFSPESPIAKQEMQYMMDAIHQRFINIVKESRGARLKLSDDLFTGRPWIGLQAKELGLIDGFSSTGELIREKIHLEDVIDYTEKMNLVDQLSKNIGASLHLGFDSRMDLTQLR